MKRKNFKCLLGLALCAVLTGSTFSPSAPAASLHPDWMGRLPDETQIRTMTIPGTHNTGALSSFMGVSGQCQTAAVKEQLHMGARVLDIRLKLENNRLKVVHSFIDQKLMLEEVLEKCTAFVRSFPSEFLLISFKEDADPAASDIAFSDKLEEMLRSCGDVIVPDASLPETLGDARGKIYVLARYDNASLGIPARQGWQDSASFPLGELYVQDHYAISDVEDKKNDILEAVRTSVSGDFAPVLNFVSCYLDHGFPPMSAAVPARQLNPWLIEFCRTAGECSGVFLCDFITPELSAALIGRNFP